MASSLEVVVPAGDGGGAAAAAEAIRQLRARIAGLKASRDKLLAEVDAQSVEIERLGNENSALVLVSKGKPCAA